MHAVLYLSFLKKTIIILTTSVCAGFLFIIVNYIDANQLLIVNLQ